MAREFDRRRRQHLFVRRCPRARLHQEPWPRHRRERHSHLQFWIVAPARLHVGFGPAVIEHELTLAVRFDVRRCHARDAAALIFKNEMAWHPSGLRADRAGILERFQKRMTDKGIMPRRIRVGARVPVRTIDFGEMRHNLDCSVGGHGNGGLSDGEHKS